MQLALFALGLAVWPLVEYAVHGWLSHRFRTPVSGFHLAHHRDARRVFTSPTAWVPLTIVIWLLLGPAFALGLLCGFARYEYVHWRIHFRAPRNARQRRLHAHHLAHHICDSKAYYGVSTRLWDRLLGTLPATWQADYARVADLPPLAGASNFGTFWPRALRSGRTR
ncbi:MAG: sterol desaturase family protein [Myxococcota bacterium]